MILRDASLLERVLFSLFFGFAKDASLSLPRVQRIIWLRWRT